MSVFFGTCEDFVLMRLQGQTIRKVSQASQMRLDVRESRTAEDN